jgi:hypothetical protein
MKWLKNFYLFEDIETTDLTVYHRAKNIDAVRSIFKNGFVVGGGNNVYGEGVYTTYDLESQMLPKMMFHGDFIIEAKVLSLDKFIIFDDKISKKVYGETSLENQFKKVFSEKWNIYKNDKDLKRLLNPTIPILKSSGSPIDPVKYFVATGRKKDYFKDIKGIIYNNSGCSCLVSFDPDNLIPIRYTDNEALSWISNI